MVMGNYGIDDDKKYTSNNGDFDHHADVAVQCGAHCPMEHILGFTRSHWMPPSGEHLRHIALAAAMVDKFVENTKTQTKHNF
jgi:hypothetical protein